MEETILIATPVGDCKAYCIAEFLRRVEAERGGMEENVHLLLYGDDLCPGGYVIKTINKWMEGKDWVTYVPGSEVIVPDDNLWQSKRVTILRQAVREIALLSPWWTHLLWWDADVFPTERAIETLLSPLPDPFVEGEIRAGAVPDWNSGCPAFGKLDPDTGAFIYASRENLSADTWYAMDTVHLAFTLAPRTAVERIGWEEEVGPDGDDGYFSRRCREEGFGIAVTTGVLAKHVHESLRSANLVKRSDGIESSFKMEKSELLTGDVAGKERAIVCLSAGGWFPPPVAWTFRRGKPVPVGDREGALRPDLAKLLLRSTRFKEKTVKRKDVRIATKLF